MLVVDTYNVLHATGVLPPDLAGLDPADLARLIAQSRYADQPTTLVCDGVRPSASTGPRVPGVELLFAGPGREADDLIERIIQASSAPGSLLVVSSDRRVIAAARRRRAATMASDAFLLRLAADRDRPRPTPLPAFTKDIPLDAYSVGHWMREFGLDPGDVDQLRRGIGLPADASAAPADPALAAKPPPQPARPSPAPAQPRPPITDPLLLEALREWAGRISPDDLDMRKWLDADGAKSPTRPARAANPRRPRTRG
jgi:hypothetical protein